MEDNRRKTGSHASSTGSSNRSHSTSNASNSRSQGTMSREEAGHLGGIAPHSCRGRQCSQGESHEAGRSTSASHRSTTSSNRSGSSRTNRNEEENN